MLCLRLCHSLLGNSRCQGAFLSGLACLESQDRRHTERMMIVIVGLPQSRAVHMRRASPEGLLLIDGERLEPRSLLYCPVKIVDPDLRSTAEAVMTTLMAAAPVQVSVEIK